MAYRGLILSWATPLGYRSDFEINGKQIGTLHTGRSSWSRFILGILSFQHFIYSGKIKIPKTVDDILCTMGNGIGIIFKKIFNNKVLVVSMTATVNR